LKNKRGVILLITLFFISAISILILQNLKQNDKFIKIVNSNIALTQTQILIQNINKEIIKYLKPYSSDDVLSKLPIELPFKLTNNINIMIQIDKFNDKDYIYLDDLKSKNTTEDFNQNVDYRYIFFQILSKYKYTTSQAQVDYIINKYIEQTKDTRILNIKDKFRYGSYSSYKDGLFLQCIYTLDIDGIKSKVNILFKHKTNKVIKQIFYFRDDDV